MNKIHKESQIGLASEICIWKVKEECKGCDLDEKLFCRPKAKYLLYFLSPLLITIVPTVLGMLFAPIDLWIKILFFASWFAYAMFFFNVWETRILCNHCPYFANDEQRVLHCPIDKGKYKSGKYDPGPLSRLEKIQFAVGALILFFFPIPFLLIAGQIIPLVLLIVGVIVWYIVIQLKVCSDCVNFACPLNKVPKQIRDEFFRKNPIILKAWEDKGYKID